LPGLSGRSRGRRSWGWGVGGWGFLEGEVLLEILKDVSVREEVIPLDRVFSDNPSENMLQDLLDMLFNQILYCNWIRYRAPTERHASSCACRIDDDISIMENFSDKPLPHFYGSDMLVS